METHYLKELKYYSKDYVENLLENDEKLLNTLLKYDIVNFNNDSYQFNYVGVIILGKSVFNIYPKYIKNEDNIENDFKQTLHVIKKYNNLNENFDYENDELEDISFNLLSMMIFFIEDYYENGIYNKIQNILEINGNGEINWDRTINDTFAIIKDNKPYYTELKTRHKIDDLFDYFRLLHEFIITECSKRLEKVGLMELFDLTPIELSDFELNDFGELDFILNKLEKELNVEFNTHKQKLLKSMHAYLSEENSLTNENYLTLYGTSTYHVIWEDVCCEVLGDKLHKRLGDLNLPKKLNSKYKSNKELIEIIKRPKWILNNGAYHNAEGTFIPDLITFYDDDFIILDAKYYKIRFNEKELIGQPGLESITKQYLYELAYREFINLHGFKCVKNGFLFPTYDSMVDNKGHVELKILSDLGLEDIQVIMLPAREMNQLYLNNKKMSIGRLNL
jgi:hypothetical protein